MCGRFTLTRSAAELAAHFELTELPSLRPRWNVAPGQAIAVVRVDGDKARRLVECRWGLRVAGERGDGSRPVPINARAETAASRPAFREALKARRGLVPADGFYEWRGAAGRRQPHHLFLPGRALFAMAALFEAREGPAGSREASVAVLTQEACGPVRALHTRMPVIVPPAAYATWLDPGLQDPSRALAEARAGDAAQALLVRPVSLRVNDVAHDDRACLGPPEAPELPLG